MKALFYQGPREIRCETFDDPKLANDRDAIVKMTRCAICGSDLQIYHGQGFSPDLGFCVGPHAAHRRRRGLRLFDAKEDGALKIVIGGVAPPLAREGQSATASPG
jgi:hypothetical protein